MGSQEKNNWKGKWCSKLAWKLELEQMVLHSFKATQLKQALSGQDTIYSNHKAESQLYQPRVACVCLVSQHTLRMIGLGLRTVSARAEDQGQGLQRASQFLHYPFVPFFSRLSIIQRSEFQARIPLLLLAIQNAAVFILIVATSIQYIHIGSYFRMFTLFEPDKEMYVK